MNNDEQPLSSSETTPERLTISAPSSPSSDEIDRNLPWAIVIGVLILAAVIFGLGRLAIINSERRDAEKKRGDAEAKRGDDLQKSVNALSSRAEEEQKFLEIVRQLLIAKSAEERKALVDQLREFQFTPPATTTTTTSSATTTTVAPRNTPTTEPSSPPTTRAPPTTSTTQPPPPTTLVCVSVPTRPSICT